MVRGLVHFSSLPTPGRHPPAMEGQGIEATGRSTRTPDAVQGSGDDGDAALGGSAGADDRADMKTSPVPWTLNLLLLLINLPFRAPSDGTGTTGGEHSADGADEFQGPRVLAAVLVILPYVASVMIWILTEFDDTVAGWSAAATGAYGLTVLLTLVLMVTGFYDVMAAVEHREDRTTTKLSSSALYSAKLGVLLSGALLVVSFSKKMEGPWGRRAAAAPSAAAVLAAVVLAVWNYRALAQAASACRRRIEDRLRRQRRGDSILPM